MALSCHFFQKVHSKIARVLEVDESGEPIRHPLINEIFSGKNGSGYFRPSN